MFQLIKIINCFKFAIVINFIQLESFAQEGAINLSTNHQDTATPTKEFELSSTTINTHNCFQINNQPYKLVWHDEFDNPDTLNKNWIIEHEEGYCSDTGVGREVSCNVEKNVQIKNGFLVLAAKYEKHFGHNFTAAKMTSKQFFSKGRIELRAAQPVGKAIRTCMYAKNTHDAYWHESGQIDLMCFKSSTDTYRGLYYANSSDEKNTVVKGVYRNMHELHVYGVEWDEARLRFFFDDLYSEPVWFEAGRGLRLWHQLIFQIGVGGIYFPPLAEDFNQLYWRCPALVFDYIRIFEKISSQPNSSCVNYDLVDHRTVNETSKLKNICKGIMDSTKYESNETEQESKTNYMPILTLIIVVAFIALTIYLLIRISKLKQQITRAHLRLNEYDNIYYETPSYEFELPKAESYLQLQEEVPSEYVPVNRVESNKMDTNCEVSDQSGEVENKYVSIKKKSIPTEEEEKETIAQKILKNHSELKSSMKIIQEEDEEEQKQPDVIPEVDGTNLTNEQEIENKSDDYQNIV